MSKNLIIYFDLETTGYFGLNVFEPSHRIIQFAAVGDYFKFNSFIDPGIPITSESTKYHGITDSVIRGSLNIKQVWYQFLNELDAYAKEHPFDKVFMMAHNCFYFDKIILMKELYSHGIEVDTHRFIFKDTDPMFRYKFPSASSHSLVNLMHDFLPLYKYDAHSALGDAEALQKLCIELGVNPYNSFSFARRDIKSLYEIRPLGEKLMYDFKILDSIDGLSKNVSPQQFCVWMKNNILGVDDGTIMITLIRIYNTDIMEFIRDNNYICKLLNK